MRPNRSCFPAVIPLIFHWRILSISIYKFYFSSELLLPWLGCLACSGVCVSLLLDLIVLFLFCEFYLSFSDLSPSLYWLFQNLSHSFLGLPAHIGGLRLLEHPSGCHFVILKAVRLICLPASFVQIYLTTTLYSRPVPRLSHITVVRLLLPSPRLLSLTASSSRTLLVLGVLWYSDLLLSVVEVSASRFAFIAFFVIHCSEIWMFFIKN